jgi:hypothetical protein
MWVFGGKDTTGESLRANRVPLAGYPVTQPSTISPSMVVVHRPSPFRQCQVRLMSRRSIISSR